MMISAFRLRALNERLSDAVAFLLFLIPVGLTAHLESQATSSGGLVSVRLEQREGKLTIPVPQNKVFRTGDQIRFRLTSRISGYLYVVNQETSGGIATLFPISKGTEQSTRIDPDQIHFVPVEGDGWFEIDGPSGFDTIYFLLTATPINVPPTATSDEEKTERPKPGAHLPPGLLPRCNDEIFKARGECIDQSAGFAPLPAGEQVPRELVPLAKTASRDIVIADDGTNVEIDPPPSAKLPLIYTFRLAHAE
jgi:hypothetical protein